VTLLPAEERKGETGPLCLLFSNVELIYAIHLFGTEFTSFFNFGHGNYLQIQFLRSLDNVIFIFKNRKSEFVFF